MSEFNIFEIEIIRVENGYLIVAGSDNVNYPNYSFRRKWVAIDIPDLQRVVGELAHQCLVKEKK